MLRDMMSDSRWRPNYWRSSGLDELMNRTRDDYKKADVTTLLQRIRVGDPDALSEIVPLIYGELHAIAGRHMRHEREDHTLQATVLVDEAFMRLAGTDKIDWQNRAHFFAIASREMRRVLVDYARAAGADKRPGAHRQVELDSGVAAIGERPVDLLALDEALAKLATWDSRKSQIVEMRFFAGLGFEEIAETLDVSTRTVKRDWAMARAWLYVELTKPLG